MNEHVSPPGGTEKKTFVLDTNVILHDSSCIHSFKEHDVVIPITVLEELDRFKKGNDSIHFQARDFLRRLDALTGDHMFTSGVSIGPNLGMIRIQLQEKTHPDLENNFAEKTPDHRILNSAYCLAAKNPGETVILVSKDINLRMKAKAVGLLAEDYTTDRIQDIEHLYTGKRMLENVEADLIDQLYETGSLSPDGFNFDPPLKTHENIIIRNHKKSALAIHDPKENLLKHVQKHSVFNITPRNAEQIFALELLLNKHIPLVSLTGRAGTGKTLLALAASLSQLDNYNQVILSRPIVPLSNKDLGFLPGEVNEKIGPYMQPLFDNLGVIKGSTPGASGATKKIEDYLAQDKLTITALPYIRGRSLNRVFFIVDEAQNLTPHEIKTIITRAGEGTKVVLTGDIFQIDHPYLDTETNGLSYLIEKMQGHELYAHINLEKGERSELSELASEIL